jgi:hypothetical protein
MCLLPPGFQPGQPVAHPPRKQTKVGIATGSNPQANQIALNKRRIRREAAEGVSARLHIQDCGEYGCSHRSQAPLLKALIPQGPRPERFGTAIAHKTSESAAAQKPVRIGPE